MSFPTSPTNGQALIYNSGTWQNGNPTSASFATTASYALSSNIPPPNIRRNLQSGSINYCGYAPTGSLESEAVWTITKITVVNDGSVTTTISNNVTWTSVPF